MRRIYNTTVIAWFFSLALSALAFAADETITITTYYPSPSGSYNELRANRIAVSPTRDMPTVASQTSLVWGEGVSALQSDQGGSIELGGLENGSITTPYIDFHQDNTGTDYEARIILNDTDTLQGNVNVMRHRKKDNSDWSRIEVHDIYFCTE